MAGYLLSLGVSGCRGCLQRCTSASLRSINTFPDFWERKPPVLEAGFS